MKISRLEGVSSLLTLLTILGLGPLRICRHHYWFYILSLIIFRFCAIKYFTPEYTRPTLYLDVAKLASASVCSPISTLLVQTGQGGLWT